MVLERLLLSLALALALLVPFPNAVHDYAYGLVFTKGVYVPNNDFLVGQPQTGQTISHTFRVFNLRPRLLVVHAEPSCGCIRVSWRDARLAPFTWKNFTMAVPEKSLIPGVPKVVALRTNRTDAPFLFTYMER